MLELDKTFSEKLFLFLLYLLTSVIILFVFIAYPGIDGYEKAQFNDVIYGQAHKPYVYRVLIPTIIRTITHITPTSIKENINSVLKEIELVQKLGWREEYLFEYFVTVILLLFLFVLFSYLLRYSVKTYFNYPKFVSDFFPILSLILLPLFFRYYNYIYDPATLCIFAGASLLIYKRKWLFYYVLFILAAFNKETSILLIVIFFLRERNLTTKMNLILHSFVQLILWFTIKIFLTNVFSSNAGSFVEFHLLGHNLNLFLYPFHLLYFIVVLTIFSVLVAYKWKTKPSFVKLCFLVTFFPLITLSLFFGFVDELRVYYESFPFVFLLSVPVIAEIFSEGSFGDVNQLIE